MAIVVGKTEEEDETRQPKDHGDRKSYSGHDPRIADTASASWNRDTVGARSRLFGKNRAPVPESYDVSLLGTLNDARSVHPGFDRRTTWRRKSASVMDFIVRATEVLTFVTKVEGKEDGTAG